MRNIFYLSLFFALSLLVACSGGAGAIQGKWVIDMEATKAEISKEMSGAQKLGADLAAGLLEGLLKEVYLELKADKTAKVNIVGQSLEGKWEMGAGGKSIVVTTKDGGNKQELQIVEVSKNRLVIAGDGNKNKKTGNLILKRAEQ